MRQGVRKLLKRAGLSIIAEGDDYNEAATGLSHLVQPVLILVIVSQAEQLNDGLSAVRSAATRFPNTKIILLTEGISEDAVLSAAANGANAVLSPKLPSDMLSHSIQLVLMNQNLFPTPPVAARENGASLSLEAPHRTAPNVAAPELPIESVMLVSLREAQIVLGPRPEEAPSPPRPATTLNLVWNSGEPVNTNSARPLTPSDREWEILQCLANGGSNKSIARQLGIAETTVKVHVKSLLRKLGVANRTQAAIWALKHGQPAAEPIFAEAGRALQGD